MKRFIVFLLCMCLSLGCASSLTTSLLSKKKITQAYLNIKKSDGVDKKEATIATIPVFKSAESMFDLAMIFEFYTR